MRKILRGAGADSDGFPALIGQQNGLTRTGKNAERPMKVFPISAGGVCPGIGRLGRGVESCARQVQTNGAQSHAPADRSKHFTSLGERIKRSEWGEERRRGRGKAVGWGMMRDAGWVKEFEDEAPPWFRSYGAAGRG